MRDHRVPAALFRAPFRIGRLVMLGALGAVLALGGCASPATVEGMTSLPSTDLSSNRQTAAMPATLRNAIEVGQVSGGKPTNPLMDTEVGNDELRAALELSLEAVSALAPAGAPATYLLDVTLVSLEQPVLAYTITVTSTVDYRVSPKTSEGKPFHIVVVQPYTATIDDAYLGMVRLRLAKERVIRANIHEFIDELIVFYSD